MKQIYLALFFMLFAGLQAQTLTQSFNEPVIGDVDKNYKLDTSAYTGGLPISTTGSNVVWNFTNLAGTFPVLIDSFISPSAATGATAYPGATFSQHRDFLYTFFKSTSNPQQTELLGAYSPSLTITFNNSAVIASYPVSYGYHLSDPVSGTFKYGNTNGACNGSITISADALGTINFPNNVSFQNVLRLKSVEEVTMTVGILPAGTIHQTIYNFYAPGKKFPVLSLNYTKYQLLAGTPTITALAYGNFSYFTVAGAGEVPQLEENYTVFPNPFKDQLFVNPAKTEEENEYLFYDLNGRLALSVADLADPRTGKLDPGVYFLQIKNRSGVAYKKIIKE